MKIVAGEFDVCMFGTIGWRLTPCLVMTEKGKWKPSKFTSEDIASVTIVDETNYKAIGAKMGWGVVGGLALGPIGLLAGLLGAGNNRQKKLATIELTDGRKAMVEGKAKDITKLLSFVF